jgi:hypothetical protein
MADITIVFMGFINQQTSLGGTILYEVHGTTIFARKMACFDPSQA